MVAWSKGGGVEVNGSSMTMTKSLRKTTTVTCCEAGDEAAACSRAGDEAAACFRVGIEDNR
jgi:hypothetical protein